jgi:hypothetical protein
MCAVPGPLTSSLFAEVDALPFPRRMALFAARTRELSGSGGLDAVLAELASGDRFERRVGLFCAVVAGRLTWVTASVADPDWRIRHAALSALLRIGDVETAGIGPAVLAAPAATRDHLYRRIRAADRTDLAEALIGQVRSRFGDREAARLLPACTAQTVARLLPEVGHEIGNWPALARRHPDVALDDAIRQLEQLSRPRRAEWWTRFGPGVLTAGRVAPHRVLDVLERFAPATYLPGDLRAYGVLAAVDPDRVLRLLTVRGRAGWLARVGLPRAVLSRLCRLHPTALVDLAHGLRDNEAALADLLGAVAPRHRAHLFDAAHAGVDRGQALPASVILDALPWERRIAEADRILGLDRVRDNEALTLHYTAFRGWPQAEPVLAAATRRGQPEERAAAHELLLACAARTREPAVVTDVIGRLTWLRNEQDPVRARALAALARVPVRLIEPELAAALEQIVADAVAARDCSTATMNAISDLAVQVLRHHYASPPLLRFAQRSLERLFGGDRLPWLGRLDTQLRRGQEIELFGAVHGWLRAGVEHGRYEPLFAIARALGHRAFALPELQTMLGNAVHAANVSSVMRQAISLWLADPATRPARVEPVLLADSSTITLPEVWHPISTNRTDLLDLVLTGSPPAGRFLATGVRWVPTHAPYVQRWLPRQQRAYADLLTRLARDAGVAIHTRAAAIAAAARIPTHGRPLVERYLDSPNVTLAEAALGALPWTDQPDHTLPTLLAHIDDDRARVATYAAGRAARFVAPDQLHPVLRGIAIASGKITSRKEAVRLADRLAVPGTGALLQEVWRQDGQHRDVRAAVVSAARQRPHDEHAWTVLTAAAGGDRDEARALLAADPFRVAERHRARYADLVTRACQHTDRETARAAWTAYPAWVQWAQDPGLVVTHLSNLDDRTVWPAVATALVALVDAGLGDQITLDAFDALAHLDTTDPTRDDPHRDRPAHRRIERLVTHLMAWSTRAGPDTDRAVLRTAGHLLAQRPDLVHHAARLLVHGVVLDGDPAPTTRHLDELCDRLTGRPVAAAAAAKVLARRLGPGTTRRPRPHP